MAFSLSLHRPLIALTLGLVVVQCYSPEPVSNLSPLQYGNASIASSLYGLGFEPKPILGSLSRLGTFGNPVKRQERVCPAGYIDCGDNEWCHPPGTECCPEDHSKNCPNGDTCCIAEDACAIEGYQCCPGTRYTCKQGTTCCPDLKSCAPAGGSCCGETVCLAGEKCCDNNHCAPSAGTCCGDGYCDEGKACCADIQACAKPGYVCCSGMKQACPQGWACCTDQNGPYCATQKCLPTLHFPHVKGITDEVQENICEGLKNYYQKNGHVEFSWNGPGKQNRKITKKNRRDSGCGGGLKCPTDYNCDEFPLASTAEGGKGATIRCVLAELNGFYGYLWNIFRIDQVKNNGFAKGSKFRVTIEDCDFTVPSAAGTKKRNLAERASNPLVLNSHGNLTIFDSSFFGNGTEGNNVVFLPLTPDVGSAGTYSLSYALSKGETITAGWIMDEDGEIYETLDALKVGASNTTSFELDDADDGPVYFFGWTRATDVQMNVTIQTPSVSSTVTSSTALPTSQPSPASSSSASAVPTTARSAAATLQIAEYCPWLIPLAFAVLL